MTPVQFVAMLFGLLVVLTRFPGIFWPKKFKKWMRINISHSLVKKISVIMVIFSLIMLYYLFPFVGFLEMIDGFFTFGLLIFGLFYFFMPHFVKHTITFWTKQKDHIISFLCLVSVLFGIVIIYSAYYLY